MGTGGQIAALSSQNLRRVVRDRDVNWQEDSPWAGGPGGGHLPNFFTRLCQRSLRNSTLSVAIFWKKTPFLLQFFGKKHAVFLANFAEMYPFLNKIAENWRVAPKILRIVVA